VTFFHRPDRPAVLDASYVETEFAKLTDRVASSDAAADSADWLGLYADWNELRSYVYSEGSRRRHRYSRFMEDAEAEEGERVHREEILPKIEDAEAKLVAALVASPHKAAIGERYGDQLLRVLEITEGPLAPVNSELRVQVGALGKSYDKVVAGGEAKVGGETLTLAKARGLMSSEDADLRREAFEAYYGWFLDQREELAGIYHDQVQLRDTMGRNLEFSDFVPLGYDGMGRTDYRQEQAAEFRDAVRTYASPLFEALCASQARALGQDTLRPWDRGYHPELTLPADVSEPVSEQLDKAGRVFARLSPKLSAHFENMRELDLIDLENRKGKRAGAYCTSFSDEKTVAILCNSVGNERDVGTLTHEMGHAFQGWESQWIEAVDLRWPTSDACEVHSMGMEYLSLPYLDEFFTSDQQERFSRSRWKRGVELLCYVSVVDAFQHWVYENPKASPDERDASWVRLQDEFLPGIDWSGEAERYRASRWYAQLHLFRYPFYYIDYAIAETGAMQLSLLDAQDHEACLATYLELCRLGGTGSVLELFKGAGLRSPFEAELMRDLMQHASEALGVSSA
jgi:M3 family oligoendopeptidase